MCCSEPLEQRVFFAFTATLDPDGTLHVAGTNRDNRLVVLNVETSVGVAGDGMPFVYYEPVFQVIVDGQAGDDTINCGVGDRPATVLGGAGNDRLVFSLEQLVGATAIGGAGDDTIIGSRNPDLLIGGPGRDRLFGSESPDTLVGGPGSDTAVDPQEEDVVLSIEQVETATPTVSTIADLTREKRVLLRAADDQAGDEVGDFHGDGQPTCLSYIK
jgi:Ca2+-binding RTX toxin-like protein